jgi:hypothetical protein
MALRSDESRAVPVFGDTVYFLALLNPADELHPAAVQFSRAARQPLITSEWVLTEVADALWQPANRSRFGQLLSILTHSPSTEIVKAESALFRRGCDLFLARRDKEWSLTDCISFIIMKDRDITEALTFDHHFEQAGFKALLRS